MGREYGPSGEPFALRRPQTTPFSHHRFYALRRPQTTPFSHHRFYALRRPQTTPFSHHRSPPGGGFIVAETSYQRHNKTFVEKDTGNITSVNTQRFGGLKP
jgi:hypothetical protein